MVMMGAPHAMVSISMEVKNRADLPIKPRVKASKYSILKDTLRKLVSSSDAVLAAKRTASPKS